MRRREVLGAVGAAATLAGCAADLPFGGEEGGSSVDAEGDIEVVVDGEPVDLSADRFQAEHAENDSLAFHLHEDDDKWYMEGDERVTVGEAVDLLPHFAYERADGADVVVVDGDEYQEDDGAEIEFSIDGEPVDPTDYRLRDGDAIRLEVSTDG